MVITVPITIKTFFFINWNFSQKYKTFLSAVGCFPPPVVFSEEKKSFSPAKILSLKNGGDFFIFTRSTTPSLGTSSVHANTNGNTGAEPKTETGEKKTDGNVTDVDFEEVKS